MGLTAEEVVASRQKYGENVLTPPKKASVWSLFLEKFKDPLIIILLFAGVLSIGIACYEYYGLHHGATVFFEPVGIFVAIFLATAVSFYFEREADKQFSILNQVHDDEPVEVIRDGNVTSIPRREVVVGDIVVLPTGVEIPADGELLEAVSLSVDESSLTGEPVCRKSIHPEDFDPNATFATNRVLRGTKVMEGHGRMRVTAVGDATENGKVFEAAQIDNSVRTPLNEQLDRLGLLVTNVSYVFAALIIVGRLIVFFDWAPVVWTLALPTALFFYLVICRFKRWRWTFKAVASTSYFLLLLAMIYYFHLSLGGAEQWDDLVTYTLNTLMIAVTLIVVSVPEGLPMAVALSLAYSMRRMLKTNNLVRKMHACETMGATTVICTDKTGTLTQNKMQVYESRFFGMPSGCLRDDAVAEGMAVNSTASLDFSDPKSPQVLGNPTEGALLLWLDQQGVDYRQLREAASIDEELPFSTERKYMATVVRSPRLGGQRVLYVKGAPEIVLSLCAQTAGDVARETIDGWLAGYQGQAMRTLGFASLPLKDGEEAIAEGKVVAKGLTFQGIVAISDPVRADVPAAVEKCMKAGILIKIVTGDTPGTAKEASDITIIDNSFSSIGKAVMWGRSLYKNIQRFLLFQLTVNVAACFIVLSGAFMGTQSPLTVTQMLWVNLIMDTFAAMALASLPPSERVMRDKPRDRKAFILTRAMYENILGVGGCFFVLLFVLLYIFEHAGITSLMDLLHVRLGASDGLTRYEETLFFTIFVMTHFFYLFCSRAFETGRSALHFKGCKGLLLIVAIIFIGQIAMVELPGIQHFFNVCDLKVADWAIIILGSSLVLWVREGWSWLKRCVG